jgi:hypothetical protein
MVSASNLYLSWMSGSHCHLSVTLDCTTTLSNKILHSSTNSSSHAHKRLLQLHASLPTSQPCAHKSTTILNLFVERSNKRANLLHKGTSPTHLSNQKKVLVPSPRTFDTLSSNQPPSISPAPSLIFAIFLHQDETLRPPTSNLPASSSYLATKTLYQNPPLSTNILQHHLPNKAMLNSFNRLNPKPPYSFCKQIELQAI